LRHRDDPFFVLCAAMSLAVTLVLAIGKCLFQKGKFKCPAIVCNEEACLTLGRVIEGYREVVKRTNEVAEAKNLIVGWNKVIQFIVEGEDDFYIRFDNGTAYFHEGKHEKPDVTLKGPEEIFYKMLTRELDQTRAYFAKQYTIEGSMADAMKFGRVGTAVAKST